MEKNGNGKASVKLLDQRAVKAALSEDWLTAIEANLSLLELDPKNVKAKMRLGRAFLQTKQFNEATKLFKEVLKFDPINKVAQKNLELAKSKKTEKNNVTDPKKLIKEPGTAEEAHLELSGRLTADSFEKGEELSFRLGKASVSVVKNGKTLGKITNGIVQRLNKGKKSGATMTVEFLKGKDKQITVLFRADQPILKAEKQDVKPYLKKGSIEEPEIELPEDNELE